MTLGSLFSLGLLIVGALGYNFGAHEATLGAVATVLGSILIYGRTR